jgi:hypothetical protein
MRGLLPEDYPGLLQGIKDRVHSAQYAALKAVNKEMIALCRYIGQMIALKNEYTFDLTIMEYALKNSGEPTSVGEYRIVSKLPKDLRSQLPTTEKIGVLLRDEG